MLATLEEIFGQMKIETPEHTFVQLHSHTSKGQGLFLQEIFDLAAPVNSLEVGLAYGISTLFILEKHKEKGNSPKCHIVIEPFPWGGIAEHNIKKEGLQDLVDIRYQKSDEILPRLFYEGRHIQFAYVDTTKVFDTVMQDFYFIDKILDVNGVIVLDDCGGVWPGVQRVARFMNTLPHYKVIARHDKVKISSKRSLAEKMISTFINMIPFKGKFYPTSNFKTDSDLGLDYGCIAFQKISVDDRKWDWDDRF